MKVLGTSFLLLLVIASFSTADDAPIVKTLDGEISGLAEESTNGRPFFSYYSIPFAEPPLGELRFKNPENGKEWEGVRDGSMWPPYCHQISYTGLLTGQIDEIGNEDCLYLNIFTPKPNEEMARLPVMVFIHGGGYILGGSQEYPPHVLMNHDIILVTIQYRLGMLGFLSTEDDEAPGNLGLKDQTMALGWIQKNIHLFGGDPLTITLFGESAGAASVHLQMLSPRSLGFFKRAILQSGSALCPWAIGGAFKAVAEYTANVFNCTTDQGSKEIISCLQKLTPEQLTVIQLHFTVWNMNPFLFGPRVDGDFLPTDPEQLMKEGRHKKLDIITGVTTHEGGLVTLPMYASEHLRSAMKLNFPEIGPISLEFNEGDVSPLNQTIKIFDYYIGGIKIDSENADNVTRMFSDRYFVIAHDLTSSIHAKNTARNKKKVFNYELTYRGERSLSDMFNIDIGKHYVSHGDELFYLFTGGPLWKPLETENDLKMREIITTLWTNFATYGDPTPDDSLGFKWDPVPKDSLPHLNLKLSPTMEDDTRAEVRKFWASLPLKQNLILDPDSVSNLVKTPLEEAEGETAPEGELPKDKVELKEKENKTQKSDNVEVKKDEL